MGEFGQRDALEYDERDLRRIKRALRR